MRFGFLAKLVSVFAALIFAAPLYFTAALFFAAPLYAVEDPPPEIVKQVQRGTILVQHEEIGGHGSGWIYDFKRRLVVTNAHVVSNFVAPSDEKQGTEVRQHFYDRVEIAFVYFDGNSFLRREPGFYTREGVAKTGRGDEAILIYADPVRDLALLQLPSLPDDLNELPLAARSQEPREEHFACGHPLKSRWNIATGTVRKRYLKNWVTSAEAGKGGMLLKAIVLESDAETKPGSSGGPILNMQGEVVAVVQGGNDEIKLYIDLSELRAFLKEAETILQAKSADEIFAKGRTYWERGMLGYAERNFREAAERRNEFTDLAADPDLDLAAVQRERLFFDESLQWCERALAEKVGRPGRAYAERAATRLAELPDEAFLPASKKGRLWRSGTRSGPLFAAYRQQLAAAEQERVAYWGPRKQAVLDDLAAALKEDPRSVLAYRTRANYLRREAAPDHARILADRDMVVRLRNNVLRRDEVSLLERAKGYYEAGQFPSAVADCQAALKIAPFSAVAHARLVKSLTAAGDHAEALRIVRFLLVAQTAADGTVLQPLDSRNPDYWELAADIEQAAGQHQDAIKDYEHLIQLMQDPLKLPWERRHFVKRAKSCVALKDYSNARAQLQLALTIPDPKADQRPDCDEVAEYQALYSKTAIEKTLAELPAD